MKWFLSTGAWYLWEALNDPQKWVIRDYVATYGDDELRKDRIAMWIGNGALFFDGYLTDGTPKFLGLFERLILWRKYKRMCSEKVAESIAKKIIGAQK